MSRAMTKNLIHMTMVVRQLGIVCVQYFTYHGELHLTAKIKIINR